jgi:hypothetical protein
VARIPLPDSIKTIRKKDLWACKDGHFNGDKTGRRFTPATGYMENQMRQNTEYCTISFNSARVVTRDPKIPIHHFNNQQILV